jgi:hypothetical protein
MAEDTASLKLDGLVSLDAFRESLGAFAALLDCIARESDPDADIRWEVAELQAGSALTVARPILHSVESASIAKRTVLKLAEYTELATIGRAEDLSPPVHEQFVRLSAVIGSDIPSLQISGGDSEWVRINSPIHAIGHAELVVDTSNLDIRNYFKTSVRGLVTTNSAARALYFTLDEAHTHRKFRCFPNERWRKTIGDAWTYRQWVAVEGRVNERAEPNTITNITDIVVYPDAGSDEWREARGSLRG